MSLQDDPLYQGVIALIVDFSTEIQVHKDIFERSVREGDGHCTMCVFYAAPDEKDYLVVAGHEDAFISLLPRISEMLHLFAARDSHAVLVTIASKIAIDNVTYDSINFFMASRQSAYVYYLPFSIDNDQVVTWRDDIAFLDELATAEMDQNGVDFVNMLHAHVHTDNAAFEASEVLNYLSYNGFAIQALNENDIVPYIDMSTFQYRPLIT